MTTIRCGAQICQYHRGGVCCAKTIEMAGDCRNNTNEQRQGIDGESEMDKQSILQRVQI